MRQLTAVDNTSIGVRRRGAPGACPPLPLHGECHTHCASPLMKICWPFLACVYTPCARAVHKTNVLTFVSKTSSVLGRHAAKWFMIMFKQTLFICSTSNLINSYLTHVAISLVDCAPLPEQSSYTLWQVFLNCKICLSADLSVYSLFNIETCTQCKNHMQMWTKGKQLSDKGTPILLWLYYAVLYYLKVQNNTGHL